MCPLHVVVSFDDMLHTFIPSLKLIGTHLFREASLEMRYREMACRLFFTMHEAKDI